ncbi:MAG: hypothetical protein KDC44_18560, partial [Phaeodactylibacter sp.]|nr:hypothetical protein [Phaeodactylibacter sp.]
MQSLATQIQNELDSRDIHCNWKQSDLARLPEQTPFLLVVNQVLRGAEELLIAKLLAEKSIPFRLLSPDQDLPEFLSPFLVSDTERSGQVWEDNFKKWTHWLQEAEQTMETLVVFLEFPNGRLGSARKRKNLEALLVAFRALKRPICPVRLHLPENLPFNSRINSRLLHLKPGALQVELRIGNPITVETQARIEAQDTFRKFLQSKIYALGTSLEVKPFFSLPFRDREAPQEPIAAPIDPQLIVQEIQSLTFA